MYVLISWNLEGIYTEPRLLGQENAVIEAIDPAPPAHSDHPPTPFTENEDDNANIQGDETEEPMANSFVQ
jgi:hypothetical protein